MRKIAVWSAIGATCLLMSVVVGCGGSGGGGAVHPPDAHTGAVAGRVLDFNSEQPLGGVTITVVYTITVDGKQRVVEKSAQTDANGNFSITGVDPGSGRLVQFAPQEWLAVPSSKAIYVDVVAGRTTQLPAPVMLIAAGEFPPDVPSL